MFEQKVRKSRLLGGLLASLAVACGFSSCADTPNTLFVVGVPVPDEQCTVDADGSTTTLVRGLYDLRFTSAYSNWILVGNQLTARGSRDLLRAETARVHLRGAIVRLTTPDDKPLTEFTTVATGFANPGTGDQAGFGTMFIDIVPEGLFTEATNVVAHIRAFGDTVGGQALESTELTFPISVCDGCLLTYGQRDPTTGGCDLSATPELPCIPGQDAPYPCQLCAGSDGLCDSS